MSVYSDVMHSCIKIVLNVIPHVVRKRNQVFISVMIMNCPIVFMLDTRKALKVKDVHFREGSFEHLKRDLENQGDQVPSLVFNESESSDVPEEQMKELKVTELKDDELENDVILNEKGEKEFTVESITGQRTYRGKQQYLIKWSGWEKP